MSKIDYVSRAVSNLRKACSEAVSKGDLKTADRFLAVLKALEMDTATSKNLLTSAEHDFMKRGEKIYAIKEVRARTGLGLKEAKDLVESYYPGSLSPTASPTA